MKKKFFYLLLVGAIVSLSSCDSHTCGACDEVYFGDGWVQFGGCYTVEDAGLEGFQSEYCSKKCCMRGPGY